MLTSEIENLRDLTIREMEVLDLVRQGMCRKEIADVLCVSLQTVKFHMGNIYRKFHINGRIRDSGRVALILIKL
jgi:NarL family two-component system response regulator LiaR